MNPRRSQAACFAFLGAALAALPAAAEPVPPPPQLSSLPAAAPRAAPAAPAGPASAASAVHAPARAASATADNVRVFEDDHVRIEETRDARGQISRVKVHSKNGGKTYEIIVPPPGKDSSQPRGTAGQAAWSVFDF